MFRIKTMNKIASVGLNQLSKEFYQVSDNYDKYDGAIVRSAKLHDVSFPQELLAIARAGAGTNNIPIDRCNKNGIVVFNTPGANANAVKELVLASMLYGSRDVLGGAEWVKEQVANGVDVTTVVEKGKSAFSGPELYGKTIGIIGLGAIGAKVANACIALGMEVIGYDPFLTVDSALHLDIHVKHTTDLNVIYKNSDFITIHIPYNKETANTIDEEAISKMKGGVRIINLARGGLVNNDAIIAALESGHVAKYVTDFPDNQLMACKNVIGTPHLGASTPESEENCAVMAARELKEYLEHGNIVNSVNMPAVSMPRSGVCRVCVIHRNVPSVLTSIMTSFSAAGMNIENMINKSRRDMAYTMVDLDTKVSENMLNTIASLPNIVRVRSIV
ncbi:MAG: 3-phosphoglycerate dehydrogenase family protein [Oscillospiraceae bacterium]|nr:3-phosphoglycerate dehydrogenase family protein [Oscillospiraceae bacterium]